MEPANRCSRRRWAAELGCREVPRIGLRRLFLVRASSSGTYGESAGKRGNAASGATGSLRFGLPQPYDAVAGFPLAALFKQFDALEALEHVPFGAGGAGSS